MLNVIGLGGAAESAAGNDLFQFDHSREPGVVHKELLRRGLVLRGSAAALAGAVLGIVVSMIVNVALVELSVSPFFRLYFGLLFLLVSGLIAYRVFSGHSTYPDESRRNQLLFFSSLVALSGVVCLLFLGHNWFIHWPRLAKVPVYSLLGTAVAFSTTFTVVDLINLFVGMFQFSAAKPLVQSVGQIRLVISIALLMGAIFGTTFGMLGVEEEVSYHVRLALMREEHNCFPIGGILGAVTGFANEYIRLKNQVYQSLEQGEFNEDI